jgi:hypothetical protein
VKDTFRIVHHRFNKEDLFEVSDGWNTRLRVAAQELPGGWLDTVLANLPTLRLVPPRKREHADTPTAAKMK